MIDGFAKNHQSLGRQLSDNAFHTIIIPKNVTRVALIKGIHRCVNFPFPVNLSINGFAFTMAMPIATSTEARPKLNAMITARPSAILPIDILKSKIASASAHGTIPPEMPSVMRLVRVTAVVSGNA